MTLFDLLFLVVFLATVAALATAVSLVLRGRRASARQLLGVVGVGVGAYLGMVTLISLVLPRRIVGLGEDQCSDDWCIAVADVSGPIAGTYRVRFRLSSRARRVAQRERFVVTYLLDGAGRRYDPSPSPQQPAFDTRLDPGDVVATERVFVVSGETPPIGVVVAREGDFAFPRCCIIGEGLFRTQPIVYAP